MAKGKSHHRGPGKAKAQPQTSKCWDCGAEARGMLLCDSCAIKWKPMRELEDEPLTPPTDRRRNGEMFGRGE